MTSPPTPSRAEQLRSLAGTLRHIRLFCIAFAALQFALYEAPDDLPHAVRPWGFAVCGWLLATNLLASRFSAGDDERRLTRVAGAEIAADSVLVLFVVALLSFDQVGAEWGLLNIVVLEAALRLRARAAILCSAATIAVYLAIQVWAASHFDIENRLNVATFRMAMVVTVALIGGGLARQLQRHLESARLAREEADERARMLRIAADAGRSLAALGTDDVLDSVMTAAVQLGFDAADVCVLDEAKRQWVLERHLNMPDAYVRNGQAADVGLSALVRREGRTIVIDDYLGWDGALAEVREGGFSTVVGVPVRAGGEVVATLGVGTRRPRPVSPAELECLELLAGHASAALDAASRQSYARDLRVQLEHSASHDRLTGLPNRASLLDRLAALMSRHDGGEVAVVVCDLDGFKTINDSLGHHSGDELLCAVARQLATTARDRLVARLAGDEFAIVVERGGVEAAARLARMLTADLRTPIRVDGEAINVSLSIGVAAEEHSSLGDPASLLRDAGLALERAKQAGRGCTELFDPTMRLHAQLRLATETDLRAAMAGGGLSVEYQPILSLETGRILGVEALARWTHPVRGPISPAEFVPLAEETGLIHELGHRVLETACRQAKRWQHVTGDRTLRVSVNISAVQLRSDRCAETIAAVLQATEVEPSCLTLELTESAVMEDVPEILRSVQALASLGVRLSVDDLGRGWSSLAYLTRYPLSELKIDRSFVQGVARRHADRAVVRALVSLAHDLGLAVVAEGIEDGDQLAELTRLGVDAGQGFHLHRPLAGTDVTDLIAAGTSLRAG